MEDVTLAMQELNRMRLPNCVVAEEVAVADEAMFTVLSECQGRRMLAGYQRDGAIAPPLVTVVTVVAICAKPFPSGPLLRWRAAH